MKKLIRFLLPVLTCTLLFQSLHAADDARLNDRLSKATMIVKELRDEKGIPQAVINNAKGIAVLRITKGGLIVSGSDGHGVVVARTATGWSAPLAFDAGGGGLGFQIGSEQSDIVFILNSQVAIDDFMRGNAFKLGADAAVTGGSDTHREGVSTTKGVIAYGRTNGAFAGVAVQGANVFFDKKTNHEAYGNATASDILSGRVVAPATAIPFYAALGK